MMDQLYFLEGDPVQVVMKLEGQPEQVYDGVVQCVCRKHSNPQLLWSYSVMDVRNYSWTFAPDGNLLDLPMPGWEYCRLRPRVVPLELPQNAEDMRELVRDVIREELSIEIRRFDDYYLELELSLGEKTIASACESVPQELRNDNVNSVY